MFKIVKKGLAKYVADAIAMYQTSGERIHVAVISALYNAATSGDVTLINRVHEGLRSNDKSALRLFIRRATILNGLALSNAPADAQVDGLPVETIQEMVKIGSVIDYKKGAFTCARNPNSDEAKSFVKLIETRLLNPDGETDKMVLDRNNFAETKTLADADILKAVLKPVNEALDGTADHKIFKMSAGVKKQLEKIKAMLETGHQQATLDQG